MNNIKILACGDVKGRIADLMKRLVRIYYIDRYVLPNYRGVSTKMKCLMYSIMFNFSQMLAKKPSYLFIVNSRKENNCF